MAADILKSSVGVQTGDKTISSRNKSVMTGGKNTEVDGSSGKITSGEIGNLQALKAAIDAVTTAVIQKTTAFTNEATEVAKVVASEIASLQPLEERINAIRSALTAVIQGVQGGGDIAGALGNLNIKVTNSNEGQQNNEALVSAIQSAIGGMSNIKIDSANVAQEITLSRVAAACEAINAKLSGSVGSTTNVTGGEKTTGATSSSSSEKNTSKTSKNTEENKKEAEAVKELNGLYEQLGKLQAQADTAKGANQK
jgi:hypothetical protein